MKKKNITKRFIAALLTVVMLLSAAPFGSLVGLDLFATIASAGNYGVFKYSIQNGEAMITDCDTKARGRISIPSTIEGYPVKCIAWYAFNDCKEITSIIVPDSVNEIGSFAFLGCRSLKNIRLPENIKRIGHSSFGGTAYSLNKRNWKNNALYVGNYLVGIDYKYNRTYTVAAGTKLIADEVFSHKGFTSISIPDSVEYIGSGAFRSCTTLKNIRLPKKLKCVDDSVFYGCKRLESISIPEEVTSIERCAFYFCTSLKSVKISKSVKTIAHSAFFNCKSLNSVTIPKSVTEIGKNAFGYICNKNNTDICYVDSSFKINCYKNSAGLKYAKANKIDFKVLDAPKHTHTYKTKSLESSILCDGYAKKRYCSICGATASKGNIITPKIASVKLSKTKFTYDGKAKKPTVTVTDTKGKKLTLGKDYTVTYEKGRIKVGSYSVTVNLIGNYRGQILLKFKINPAKPTGVKATRFEKGVEISWKKAKGAGYYWVEYSTEKDGKYTILGETYYLSFFTNKLQRNKTYYFRVKANKKTANGMRYESGYSKIVQIKVK